MIRASYRSVANVSVTLVVVKNLGTALPSSERTGTPPRPHVLAVGNGQPAA
jgi:hypothetical protein